MVFGLLAGTSADKVINFTRSKSVHVNDLAVGDVLLFKEKSADFAAFGGCRCIAYTFAAFVARTDTVTGAQLCGHFPLSADTAPGPRPRFERLRDQLSSGRYDAIFVRRLCHAFDASATAVVQQLADDVCAHERDAGDELEPTSPLMEATLDEEVVVLMANAASGWRSRLTCTPRVERFLTSRLVASMLCRTRQVTQDGHTFIAVTPDERVFYPAQDLPGWLLTQASPRRASLTAFSKGAELA